MQSIYWVQCLVALRKACYKGGPLHQSTLSDKCRVLLFCSRDVPKPGFPVYIVDLRRARSRRDGFVGVRPSGRDGWGVLVWAMNDSVWR
jgi:hypothetical protein